MIQQRLSIFWAIRSEHVYRKTGMENTLLTSHLHSNKVSKRIRYEVKQLKWNLRSGDSLEKLASECNAKIDGWTLSPKH